jgi:hypothetical protein
VKRVITVILAGLILLGSGYFVGRRPVSRLRAEVEAAHQQVKLRVGELESEKAQAEATGYLWQARAELLVASLDVEKANYGTASERAKRAAELITRAGAVPGLRLDLNEVQGLVTGAEERIGALDPQAQTALVAAATALGRLLDRRHA